MDGKTWVYEFFLKCALNMKNSQDRELLITKVMLETIDILSSIYKLQLEMEIVGKIKKKLTPKHE